MKLAMALLLGAIAASKAGAGAPANAVTVDGEVLTIDGEILIIT